MDFEVRAQNEMEVRGDMSLDDRVRSMDDLPIDDAALGSSRTFGSEHDLREIRAAVDEVRGTRFRELLTDIAIQDGYLGHDFGDDQDEDDFDDFTLLPPDPAWQ